MLWLRRNARQVCDGGLIRRGMHRDTVDCEASNLYRVADIAYIRAAGDCTDVHLSSGQVAIVMRRLRHWEARKGVRSS